MRRSADPQSRTRLALNGRAAPYNSSRSAAAPHAGRAHRHRHEPEPRPPAALSVPEARGAVQGPASRARACARSICPSASPSTPHPPFIRQALSREPGRSGRDTRPPLAASRCARRSRAGSSAATGSPRSTPASRSCRSTAAARRCSPSPRRWSTPRAPGARVVMPNPFYQIYEGATLLAGRRAGVPQHPRRRTASASILAQLPESVWADTQLLYVCSPGQSDRQRDDAGGLGTRVRAVRPPRLRHRHRRVLLGDLFRRGRAAAGRPAGGAAPRPRRFSAAGGVRQPVQALQRARHALRLSSPAMPPSWRSSCSTAPTTAAP